jgi:hypothetical protein
LQQVTFIAIGSPADKSEIKAGDIVTKTDDIIVRKKLKNWTTTEYHKFDVVIMGAYTIYDKPMFSYLNRSSIQGSQKQGDNRIVNFEIKRGK